MRRGGVLVVGAVLLTLEAVMDVTQYTNRPDWATEIKYHNGTVEQFKHCGRCLAVIPREVCEHCNGQATEAVKAERHKLEGGD